MKNTIIAIILAAGLIIFAVALNNKKTENPNKNTTKENTSVNNEDNTKINTVSEKTDKNLPKDNSVSNNNSQIIEISAKGGYTPRKSIAKAGIPTILRFNTNGTFDCSSSVRIPSMGIFKYLPQSGSTDIDLGIQKTGTLNGSCGMGMYPFEIEFQ